MKSLKKSNQPDQEENRLPALGNHQSIELSEKEIVLSGVIAHVNQLTSFAMNDTQIEEWARGINEIRPNQDPVILKKIIVMMKLGEIEYDHRLGVQNIFKALKMYDRIKIGFVILDKATADTPEKRHYFHDGEKYPPNMQWLVDKEQYESIRLKTQVREQSDDVMN